ncbi:MAG: hypothetical protein M3N08_07810 [Pseudomonadota bacterium]|nr:hypothetical protein [Pseudomonadota bacterium]
MTALSLSALPGTANTAVLTKPASAHVARVPEGSTTESHVARPEYALQSSSPAGSFASPLSNAAYQPASPAPLASAGTTNGVPAQIHANETPAHPQPHTTTISALLGFGPEPTLGRSPAAPAQATNASALGTFASSALVYAASAQDSGHGDTGVGAASDTTSGSNTLVAAQPGNTSQDTGSNSNDGQAAPGQTGTPDPSPPYTALASTGSPTIRGGAINVLA